ncbi:MAG: ABC transporter permease subunit [Defluviimonas sp.]|uniref:ABC transporter permease subunit n=1 Tax=Albidovulum sp. TaxID=1872424 RepID=UPI002A3286D0|nr:ABC transporter permease subunit [Defluviimonas sp.]
MTPATLIARKEAGELLFSLRGLAWLLALCAALSSFTLLLVGSTELSLLDNAQVVCDMAGLITVLASLLALIVGIDATAGERERGSLVPLLLIPTPRRMILLGKLGGILIAWIAMFLLSIPYLWAVGSTGQNLAEGVALVAILGTPVVLTFGFLGMALGSWMPSARACLMTGMIALAVSASPLVIGPSLRQSAIGRIFDAINPLSGTVNAYDAVIIDGKPIIAQWPGLVLALAWLAIVLASAVAAFDRLSR